MAFSAHQKEEMLVEHFDDEQVLQAKVEELASLFKASKFSVVFTGAGISTSTGIPDYRSPTGVWTLAAKGKQAEQKVSMLAAVPSPTHMSLAALLHSGRLNGLISQNVDGLHRKTLTSLGVPLSSLVELHGNVCVEKCVKCNREYSRDYNVCTALDARSHMTGRACAAVDCGGALMDTIINFGEDLVIEHIKQGFKYSDQAELHVVLGSSLTVRPACDMPRASVHRGGKLVIVNLQKTPLDDIAHLRIFARCDEVMRRLMAILGEDIPSFILKRDVVMWRSKNEETGEEQVMVSGLDAGNTSVPCSFISKAVSGEGYEAKLDSLTGVACFPCPRSSPLSVRLSFFGHYNEPEVELTIAPGIGKQAYLLSLPIGSNSWNVAADDSAAPPELCKPGTEIVLPPAAVLSAASSMGSWFAVEPIATCPHLDEGVDFQQCTSHGALSHQAACLDCGNVGENMICLKCGDVHCGRHVHGHMLKHNEETSHPVVLGFIDLSIWCYSCEAYINPRNERIRDAHAALYIAKFGNTPPSYTGRLVPSRIETVSEEGDEDDSPSTAPAS